MVGNQNTDSVVSFRVLSNGGLEWTGHEITEASPANMRF